MKVRNRLPRGAGLAEGTGAAAVLPASLSEPRSEAIDCYLDQVTGFVNRLLRLPEPAAAVALGGSRRPLKPRGGGRT